MVTHEARLGRAGDDGPLSLPVAMPFFISRRFAITSPRRESAKAARRRHIERAGNVDDRDRAAALVDELARRREKRWAEHVVEYLVSQDDQAIFAHPRVSTVQKLVEHAAVEKLGPGHAWRPQKRPSEAQPGLHRSSLVQEVIEGRLDEVRPDQRPVHVEVAGGQGGISSRKCAVESRRGPETVANA